MMGRVGLTTESCSAYLLMPCVPSVQYLAAFVANIRNTLHGSHQHEIRTLPSGPAAGVAPPRGAAAAPRQHWQLGLLHAQQAAAHAPQHWNVGLHTKQTMT